MKIGRHELTLLTLPHNLLCRAGKILSRNDWRTEQNGDLFFTHRSRNLAGTEVLYCVMFWI